MENKCDVLVMVWGMVGRDAQALIPIIYLLREKYNLAVQVRSIFEYSAINYLRPKVLLTNGCTGSSQTYLVTKYATERGIYTVSLHAEGMFRKEDLETSVIGWNKDKVPTVKKWYMWNQNAYNWTIEEYPQFSQVLDVAGSTLHEKYHIFRASDFRADRLLEKRFDSMMFYVGWAFDRAERFGNRSRQKLAQDRKFVVQCLRAIAIEYPNKLLILKYHPATFDESKTEIHHHFDEYDNVMILHDEYPIYELIIISDIVLSFDSTTNIDAWLSGKTTISLCRDRTYGYASIREGSLVPGDETQLLAYLNEFFIKGQVRELENKEGIRKKVICDSVGDLGRKPSAVIAEHIYHSLDKVSEPRGKLDCVLFVRGLLNRIFYNYKFLPPIGQFSHMRRHYKPDKFAKQYDHFAPKLKRYYGI